MQTDALYSRFSRFGFIRDVIDHQISQGGQPKKLPVLAYGGSESVQFVTLGCYAKELKEQTSRPLVILVPKEQLGARLCQYFNKIGVKSEFYPYRDFNFYDMAASHEIESVRLQILSLLSSGSLDCVVCCPDALLQLTIPREVLSLHTFSVSKGETLDRDEFCKKLVLCGYTPCEFAESEGQFAVRGGIVDIFPTKSTIQKKNETLVSSAPIRLEWFGDEIDRMMLFDAQTQRSGESIDRFQIAPSREILVSDSQKEDLDTVLQTLASQAQTVDASAELRKECESLKNLGECSYFDRFISLFYPQRESLLDYCLGDNVVVYDYFGCKELLARSRESEDAMKSRMLSEGLLLPAYATFSKEEESLDRFLQSGTLLLLEDFLRSFPFELHSLSALDGTSATSPHATATDLLPALREHIRKNERVFLVCKYEMQEKKVCQFLQSEDIPAHILEENEEAQEGVCSLIIDSFPDGMIVPSERFALYVLSSKGEDERTHKRKKERFNRELTEKIVSFTDLTVGDYVVHMRYGIGKFLGIVNLMTYGAHRDYVAIQYQGSDKLYLPVDQLDMVAKYIGAGSDEHSVRLSKMGGADWVKATTKAKESAKEMAKELISLYAKRLKVEGFACQPDDLMEREFASSFEFDETPSQLQAIEEIKKDMQRPYPMDRVLCGDVGFGKTEVAFRSAMKAIANGKQVALLVPTTILCMQHYQTALERFSGTGVSIGCVSRFQSTRTVNKVIKELKEGTLDFIIGTHKLLNDKIAFKNLGLLIVDEEQRFGVLQKEKIKELCPCVDVLTLSATPIPRTLSMAMGGIRDMSVLSDAPVNRVGVSSYVLEYDKGILHDAIVKELHRGGQVFYLFNNVDMIYLTAKRLGEEFPQAVIEVAHGQMDKSALEDIWQRLVRGEIDILVTTTIIETGIDIPNANTLIVENADKMGLGALHQIRGRVGRTNKRAYAYFTYRKDKVLTEIATKRLKAIRDFAEFGGGFKIAMRDLEIRGAGNLLGSAQHGHLDAVGYDMYIKLLNDAVLEEKGQKPEESYETLVLVSSDAFLPKTYIASQSGRMEIYKKIAHISSLEEYRDTEQELTDRFGKIPPSAQMLLQTALLKSYASRAMMKKAEILRDEIRLFPLTPDLNIFVEISRLDPQNILICGIKSTPYICVRIVDNPHYQDDFIRVLTLYAQKLKK